MSREGRGKRTEMSSKIDESSFYEPTPYLLLVRSVLHHSQYGVITTYGGKIVFPAYLKI